MGLDLDRPIEYVYSSLRQFGENERHVKRICEENILLLVFDGILRFSEDGEEQTVCSGEYYIQRAGGFQNGIIASDKPRYLFVHFRANWDDNDKRIEYRGTFSFEAMKDLIFKLDMLVFNKAPHFEKSLVFYTILSKLINPVKDNSLPSRIQHFIQENYKNNIHLDEISECFGFSKNYIINVFKKAYGFTPKEYLTNIRIQNAKHLIKTTSSSLESIASSCGFSDYSHFYRAFLSLENKSPKIYKKESRQVRFPSYRKYHI